MTADDQSPIKIDVGVSAKAEIKAEIPTASMGRLVDALTDAIRPFTEGRGLRADLIRLQREEVALEVVRRAKKRIALEQMDVRPIPLKILVPLLEQASLEEPESELIEKWSELLVSACAAADISINWCVQILAVIDSWQARTLDKLAAAETNFSLFEVDNYTRGNVDADFANWLAILSHTPSESIRRRLSDVPGFNMFFDGDNIPNTEMFYMNGLFEGSRLQHLDALGLVWVNAARFRNNKNRYFLLNARLTPLGYEFVQACQGNAD